MFVSDGDVKPDLCVQGLFQLTLVIQGIILLTSSGQIVVYRLDLNIASSTVNTDKQLQVV